MTKSVEIFERANAAIAAMQKTADAHGCGQVWRELPDATIDTKIFALRAAWAARCLVCAKALEAAMQVDEEVCSVVPDLSKAEFWCKRVEEYMRWTAPETVEVDQ